MYIDEEVTARVSVKDVQPGRRTVEMITECRKADGTLAISGIAHALYPRPPMSNDSSDT